MIGEGREKMIKEVCVVHLKRLMTINYFLLLYTQNPHQHKSSQQQKTQAVKRNA
jgi:hypothetical protein